MGIAALCPARAVARGGPSSRRRGSASSRAPGRSSVPMNEEEEEVTIRVSHRRVSMGIGERLLRGWTLMAECCPRCVSQAPGARVGGEVGRGTPTARLNQTLTARLNQMLTVRMNQMLTVCMKSMNADRANEIDQG